MHDGASEAFFFTSKAAVTIYTLQFCCDGKLKETLKKKTI
jgi:hypothetical protein